MSTIDRNLDTCVNRSKGLYSLIKVKAKKERKNKPNFHPFRSRDFYLMFISSVMTRVVHCNKLLCVHQCCLFMVVRFLTYCCNWLVRTCLSSISQVHVFIGLCSSNSLPKKSELKSEISVFN